MVAVMKFASVPANIARAEPRQIVPPVRRQRANPADLDANRAEVGESAQGECGDRERLGIERRLSGPSCEVYEFIDRHARAEQIADDRRVAPGHAHAPRDGREHPAENLLQAQVDQAERRVHERDQSQKRNQHRADVQRQTQPLAGPRPAASMTLTSVRSPSTAAPHRFRRFNLRHHHLGHHDRAGRRLITAVNRCFASMPKGFTRP